jgi:hypothetical protein
LFPTVLRKEFLATSLHRFSLCKRGREKLTPPGGIDKRKEETRHKIPPGVTPLHLHAWKLVEREDRKKV